MYRLAWILGAIGLPLAHYWLISQVEPFYSSIYCFLWWSFIFLEDFVVCLLRGTSLLRDRPREFFVLVIWSAPVWLLFEMVNLRIHNWDHVMAPSSFSWGMVYQVLAFASVLPGIFETTELIVGIIEKVSPHGKITGRPFRVTGWNVVIQMLIGAIMLVLLLIFPGSCSCLAWGFVFFLIDPLCYWLARNEPNHIGRSLLGQLASGDNTRFIALIVAGVICGGLWETWNLDARTKWIYSVPFFDELKIGEMPVLGFLGFPPFVLECYAIMNLLSCFRDGRNWELSAQENSERRGMPGRTIAIGAQLMIPAVFFAGVATMRSVESYAVPLDWRFASELGARGIAALREREALQGNQFLKLPERPEEINPVLWARMRRIARMGELKGMGLDNALALERLKIMYPEDLAKQEPAELASRMRRAGRIARDEEVKVWVLAARRKTGEFVNHRESAKAEP